MQPIPPELSHRDVNQWLSNTWFVHEGRPVMFQECQPAAAGVLIFGHTTTNQRVAVTASEAFIHWPRCGSINIRDKFACHVTRVTQRAYTRSYSGRQVHVEVPKRWELFGFLASEADQQIAAGLGGDSNEVVLGLFNTSYPPVSAAREDISRGAKFSVAVSPSVILCRGDGETSVYYRGKHIGDMRNGKLINHEIDPAIEVRLRKLLEI